MVPFVGMGANGVKLAAKAKNAFDFGRGAKGEWKVGQSIKNLTSKKMFLLEYSKTKILEK